MTTTELNELIITKLGVKPGTLYADFAVNAVRFIWQSNEYRVTTDLNVEKVDGACLVSDSDARHLEKLLRGEQWDGTSLPPVGTERDKGILQMFSIIDSSDDGSIYLAENLYDAIVAGKIDGLDKVG